MIIHYFLYLKSKMITLIVLSFNMNQIVKMLLFLLENRIKMQTKTIKYKRYSRDANDAPGNTFKELIMFAISILL